MGQDTKPVTIGFRYFLGIHFGLAKGINGVREIRVGDRRAWTGDAQGQARWNIKASSLFGGDQGEGGIHGSIDLMQGWEDQPVNPRVQRMLGSALVPAFRGCVTAFYDGLVCSMNPYPKPWAFRAWRTTADWDGPVWYPERLAIMLAEGSIAAMNPAHILYEAITNRDWGRGRSAAHINDASFRAAADTLADEGLGLCICWRQQDGIGALVQSVIDHIGAVLIDDRGTNQISLKLLRADYVVADLPLFDEDSGLLEILEDSAADGAGAVNEVVVQFTNMAAGGANGLVRVQSLAGIQSVGAVNSETVDYPYAPTADLALRLAQRDLAAKASSIRRFKVRLDRRASGVMPGAVIRVRSLRRGYAQLVLRVGKSDYGTLNNGAITLTCISDSFGLPEQSFVQYVPPIVSPPSTDPKPATVRRLLEVPYRDLAAYLTPEQLAAITPTSCAVAMLARRPSAAALGYYLLTRVGSADWLAVDQGDWCPTAQIATDLDFLTTATRITYQTDCSTVKAGAVGVLGDEIVRVAAFNLDTGDLVLARGCSDTVPTRHLKGARIWFYGLDAAVDPADYASGVSVQAKVQTRTSAGLLAVADAPVDSLTLSQRQYRPFPPGNVKVGGVTYPASVAGNIVVTWSHRSRLLQADQLVDTTQGNIGPEAGTTYSYRLLRESDNSVLVSNNGVSGTSATLVTGYTGLVTLELWAVRDGFESQQRHRHTFTHSIPDTGPAHRYWRLLYSSLSGSDSYSGISELQLRSTAGGASIAVGGTATASSYYSTGFTAAEAFDGSLSTSWSSAGGDNVSAWIAYQLPSVAEVVEVALSVQLTSSLLKFAAMITPTASGSSGRARLLPV